jgi:hypothetical protein
MIRLIAISHIRTSKNPTSGATLFIPLVVKIILRVPSETSMIRATKMKSGSMTYVTRSELSTSMILTNILELAKL